MASWASSLRGNWGKEVFDADSPGRGFRLTPIRRKHAGCPQDSGWEETYVATYGCVDGITLATITPVAYGPPDCTIDVWYRPTAGSSLLPNHVIIRTLIAGQWRTYEGEPTPAVSVGELLEFAATLIFTSGTSTTTQSLLTGVPTNSPSGTAGLGTKLASISGYFGGTTSGHDVCLDAANLAVTNKLYNQHKLHYALNGEPNSNSYAYTLLNSVGLVGTGAPFGPPPNDIGWGYNVITNLNHYQ